MKEWYKKKPDEIESSLKTDLKLGLSQEEATHRLDLYGPNEFKEEKGKSFFARLLGQFSDFLVLILIAAAIISMAVGESRDAIVILAIIILNAFLGLSTY